MGSSVIAIVPAAGSGERFGKDINKAFFEILGKPVLIWALEMFQRSALIKEIIPVFSDVDMERGLDLIEKYSLSKVKKIAPGGKERQFSVLNALDLVDDRSSTVLIHDGARPVIDEALIKRCINALGKNDGAICGVPLKDTVKEIRDGKVSGTLDRDSLISVQTPQVFRYRTIAGAFSKTKGKNIEFTDDAAVVEYSGGTVVVAMGSYRNIKITTPDDAIIAEAFLKELDAG